QHGDIGLRRCPNPLEDDQHLLVTADHFAEALNRWRLVFGAGGRAALQERIEEDCRLFVIRPRRGESRRRAGETSHDAENDEFIQTILAAQTEAADAAPAPDRATVLAG